MERGDEKDIMSRCSLSPRFRKERLPLVMISLVPSSTKRSFLDISTMKFHDIVCPYFEDAYSCIYSKGGWLLMQRRDIQLVFLLNPITGVKYDLPRFPGDPKGRFTFSIVAGTPDRVVHVYNNVLLVNLRITIRVVSPGDSTWKVHEFKCYEPSQSIGFVVVDGNIVTCLHNHASGGVALDLSEDRWWVVPPHNRQDPFGMVHFVESEGEVVKAHLHGPRFNSYNFWRLDIRSLDWVAMNEHELENTSWFLGGTRSFCARGAGKKVYTLMPNNFKPVEPSEPGQPLLGFGRATRVIVKCKEVIPAEVDGIPDCNIYVQNLEDGTTSSLLPESFKGRRFWVDVALLG